MSAGEISRPRPWSYLSTLDPAPGPPLQQSCFELDEKTLWRYLASSGAQIPYGLLMNFFTDLCYSPTVDTRVFLYLLRPTLDMWGSCFTPERDLEALQATGEFHSGLFAKSEVVRASMGPKNEENVIRFMRDTLNWFLSTGRSSLEDPDLRWVPMWVGASCGLPGLVDSVFDMLESTEPTPRLDTYLAYLSRFAYTPAENPIMPNSFDGPEPWHRATFITSGIKWKTAALESARKHLGATYVVSHLEKVRLSVAPGGLHEIIASDLIAKASVVEERAAEALSKLATFEPSPYWSDAF